MKSFLLCCIHTLCRPHALAWMDQLVVGGAGLYAPRVRDGPLTLTRPAVEARLTKSSLSFCRCTKSLDVRLILDQSCRQNVSVELWKRLILDL